MTTQQQMKSTLERAGLPYKAIDCYGRQIVVTAWCEESARKWAILLSHFATLRGVCKGLDEKAETKGKGIKPAYIQVWRAFAAIK